MSNEDESKRLTKERDEAVAKLQAERDRYEAEGMFSSPYHHELLNKVANTGMQTVHEMGMELDDLRYRIIVEEGKNRELAAQIAVMQEAVKEIGTEIFYLDDLDPGRGSACVGCGTVTRYHINYDIDDDGSVVHRPCPIDTLLSAMPPVAARRMQEATTQEAIRNLTDVLNMAKELGIVNPTPLEQTLEILRGIDV